MTTQVHIGNDGEYVLEVRITDLDYDPPITYVQPGQTVAVQVGRATKLEIVRCMKPK